MSTGPLVLLIGAPLPPPYGGIARYMQLCLPAMARKGYRLRIVQPDQEVEPQATRTGFRPTRTSRWPSSRIRAPCGWRPGSCVGPGSRPGSSLCMRTPSCDARASPAKQLAATACWIRAGEELLGGERPSITHAYDWPWSHGAAAVLLAETRGGKSMVSLFGDVLPHLDELTQFDAVSRPFLTTSRKVLRRADLVASMTEHCRRLVRHVDVLPDEVALVRVMGDMQPFHPGVDGTELRGRHAPEGGR